MRRTIDMAMVMAIQRTGMHRMDMAMHLATLVAMGMAHPHTVVIMAMHIRRATTDTAP